MKFRLVLILIISVSLYGCNVSRIYDLNDYQADDFDTNATIWKEFKQNLVVYIPCNWSDNTLYGHQQLLIARCTKGRHQKLRRLLWEFWIESAKVVPKADKSKPVSLPTVNDNN